MSRSKTLAIFAIALAVRLLHVWQIRSAPFFSLLMGDSRGYDEWAQRLAAGDWVGHDVFYQAPLYPYFLGVVYAVAGRSVLLVRVVQAVIGSASCVLLAHAAARLFSPRAGLVAGLMLALYAPAIFFDGLLQKSVLDVFFVCLALAFIASIANPQSIRNPQSAIRNAVPLGLAMGALALTRENAIVLIVVLLGWTMLQASWRGAAAFALGLALVLVPVAARNAYVGGGFYLTTSQFGPNFYIGNNPRADGTYASLRYGRGAPEYERQDATDLAEHALGRRLTPAEVSSFWTDRALTFVTGSPLDWARLEARKIALLLNRTEMVDTEDQATHAEWSWPLRWLGPITHFGVLVPLALLGVIVTWPRRRELRVLHAMVLAYAASVVMFYVFARYRFPLVPFLVLFAASALEGRQPSSADRHRHEDTKTRKHETGLVQDIFFVLSWFRDFVSRRPVAGAAVAAAALFANWPLLSTAHMRAVTENNLGVALQEARRYDEAATHYERAIALRSDYAPAYSNLGTALRAQGRTADAIAGYERALALQPDYPDAHYNLANALLDAGRADAAIEHFQTALRSVPVSVETHNNLAIALAAKGRAEDARAEWETALRLDPDSANAHRNLGDLLSNMGRGPEALEHFRRATELAPENGEFRYDYGSLLLELRRSGAAEQELRAATRLLPSSAKVHNNLGISLAMQGKVQEAVEQFQVAVKLDPNFADARRNLEMAGGGGRGRD